MEPTLASLYPIHQIGSDGFNWWVGQIESGKNDDPKKSGRYRVRIVGQHLKDCNATKTEDLPWANVMMPVTSPFTDGGTTGASVNLKVGNWVIGFYIDNDRQKPIILGSIGHTAGATLLKNVETDPAPGSSCKSFTTFLDPDRNPYKHSPLPEKEKVDGDTSKDDTKYTKVGDAGLPADAVPGFQSAAFYGLFAENTATNPTGSKICVEIANPNCGSENDLKGGLTNILSGMLAANQQSGGQLGDYYVSKINGELTRYADYARTYVNKAVRLVKSFIARIKGEIVKVIRDGINSLVDLTLKADVAATDELGNVNTGPVNPDLGIKPFQPITKKENRLKPVIDLMNQVLDDLGCAMEDITDQIAQWLTDLLFGYLMEAFRAAACLVDTLINGIINELVSLLDGVINAVLGPLQELIGVLASPLNLIGSAINKVFELLGISCDGPKAQCEKVTKECVDCGVNETEDWLDKLISEIESGPSAGDYVCDEAKTAEEIATTAITFVGGIFEPASTPTASSSTASLSNVLIYQCSNIITVEGRTAKFTILRSGNTTVSSSISFSTIDGTATRGQDYEYIGTSSTIGFSPGETQKTLSFRIFTDSSKETTEDFSINLSESVTPSGMISYFPEGRTFNCEILDYSLARATSSPASDDTVDTKTSRSALSTINTPSLTATRNVTLTQTLNSIIPVVKKYFVVSDKSFYNGGEKIIYTITTENVENNTTLNYTLTGDITAADISGGQLTGTFIIQNGTATVEVLTTERSDDAVDERIIFSIDDTNAETAALILGEEILTPSYLVTADRNSVSEGETITYTIKTTNISDNTTLNYTLSGDNITRTDIVGYSLTGSFKVVSNQAEVEVTITGDGEIEASEILTFTIDDTTASVDVLISPDPITPEEEIVPTFTVVADKTEYSEGETIIYTITTQNVADGTVLRYTLLGQNINSSDFISEKTTDTFVVLNNTAKVYVGLADDASFESNETLTFIINGTTASTSVTILGQEVSKDITIIDVVNPCINPPTAGTPVTDDDGGIISVPIIEQGCPYQQPPKVIVTGAGYGASAIALLDETGKVSEIRMTRTGIGYKKNTASNANLTCVIDSYTILSPGRGYTSEPTVYVNGETGIAKARINDDGYVFGIEVIDRLREYKKIPSIKIIGGGGSGARVLPSLTCLDSQELERKGYAKIGTGKYIDCP